MLSSFHAAGRVDPYWATAVVTASTALPATAFALAGDHRLPAPGRLPTLTLIALAGVVGDLAYAAASRDGSLSVVSAISSLYPLSTIVLGVVVLGQRSTRVQTAGIILALAGAALLGARG
jgi:drug/metabolite transporter (DMT)-like permease